MKKISFLFLLPLLGNLCYAQLRVFDSGKVVMRSDSLSQVIMPPFVNAPSESVISELSVNKVKSQLDVLGTGTALNVSRVYTPDGSWGYGVHSISYPTGNFFSVGIEGESRYNTTFGAAAGNGRSYGVRGIAGGGSEGWNFGLFGRLEGGL